MEIQRELVVSDKCQRLAQPAERACAVQFQ